MKKRFLVCSMALAIGSTTITSNAASIPKFEEKLSSDSHYDFVGVRGSEITDPTKSAGQQIDNGGSSNNAWIANKGKVDVNNGGIITYAKVGFSRTAKNLLKLVADKNYNKIYNRVGKNTDGELHIYEGGIGRGIQVIGQGYMTVQNGGTIEDTSVKQNGLLFLNSNSESKDILLVERHGHLIIQNGDLDSINSDFQSGIKIENITAQGLVDILNVAEVTNEKPIKLKEFESNKFKGYLNTSLRNLHMENGVVRMTPYSDRFSKNHYFNELVMENLSGKGDFILSAQIADNISDKVIVNNKASGEFKLFVTDTGKQVVDDSENIELVQINSGKAKFNLGNKNKAVDLGIYKYRLYKGTKDDGKSFWYLASQQNKPEPSLPAVSLKPTESLNDTPKVKLVENTDTDAALADDGQNNKLDEKLVDNKKQNLEPESSTPILANDTKDKYDIAAPQHVNPRLYEVLSNSAVSALSMSSVNRQILNSESIDWAARSHVSRYKSAGQYGVWTNYLNDNIKFHDEQAVGFKNKTNRVEIGYDKYNKVRFGAVTIGLFTGFGKTSSRFSYSPGKGTTESYSLGGYLNWQHNDYYLDGQLKGSHFKNNLTTYSSNEDRVTGKYKQNALTVSLEKGKTVALHENINIVPYGKFTYSRFSAPSYQLSNGMAVDIHNTDSARGELGARLNLQLDINGVSVKPFVKAGIANEFIKTNKVTLNNKKFSNKNESVVGQYQLGTVIDITQNTHVTTGVGYRQGNKLESPISANIGLKVSF